MASEKKKHTFEPVGDIVSIFQRGRRWYANFQQGGKQHRKALGTTSKKEARRRAIQLEADVLQGRYQRTLPPPALASAVEDYQKFLRTEGRAQRTLAKYAKIFERLSELARRRRVRTLDGLSFARPLRVSDVRADPVLVAFMTWARGSAAGGCS